MMKKIALCALCICLCLALLACKSEEVKNVEALIEDLGKITLDSGDVIAEVEEAYDDLSSDDQEKVENYGDLEDARETYDELVAEEQRRIEEENQKKIAAVEDQINALGTITLDSEPAIAEARSAYDALEPALQEQVSNLDVLTAAEEQYALLESVVITEWLDLDTSIFDGYTLTFTTSYEDDLLPEFFTLLCHDMALTADVFDLNWLELDQMYIARHHGEQRVDAIALLNDGRIMYIQYWFGQNVAQIGFQETDLYAREYMDILMDIGLIDEYKNVSGTDYLGWINYLFG